MKLFITVAVFFFALSGSAHAASLSQVSDLVSDSRVSTSTTHEIVFTLTNAVPASGLIRVRPQSGAFTIPSGFDYTDVDLAVSSGGPYVERTLAASASATEDGVTVTTGSSGSVTLVLNASTGVAAGDSVRIRFGTNASHGTTGNVSLTNPSSVGSYRMIFETFTAGSVSIDYGETRITILEPITASVTPDLTAPVRSNGLPSGALSHGNANIEISLNTDEPATCRYATSTGVTYSSMLGTFVQSNATLHTRVVTGHENGTSYNYYVRCIGEDLFPNPDDYTISFSLNATPTVTVSTGSTDTVQSGGGGGGGGGVGDFYGGSQTLYLASVTLSGFFSPLTTYTILQDGVKVKTGQVTDQGKFQTTISNLERGAYTFSIYAEDTKGKKSATVNQTLSVVQGTSNTLSNILIPPTLTLQKDSIQPGDTVGVSGETVPGATIEVFVLPQGSAITLGGAQKYLATSSPNGSWSATISSTGLEVGTFEVKARAFYTQSESTFSAVQFLGVGESPSPEFSLRADINKDGKVNLTDFSILLSFWGRSDDNADINLDGNINLADFSILLFNWTG